MLFAGGEMEKVALQDVGDRGIGISVLVVWQWRWSFDEILSRWWK